MKFRVLYILAIIGLISYNSYGQRVAGARIGYIDTEFILQNVPEYQQATSQLEVKLSKWKSEIEKKLADIETKKKSLENEKVLLTKELYEERLEDISFEEAEVIDYQQKRFGPGGDMVIQRSQLIQPIQDQIYAAVNEIAENKKYDFVFDKNADFLMLYSAERFDISEQVLRIITRTSAREQAKTKQEKRALEKEEVVPIVNDTQDERQKALEERKAKRKADLEQKRLDREKALEERRQKQKDAREAKRKEADARRQKVLDSRNKEKTTEEKKTSEKAKDSTTSKINASTAEKSKTAVKKDTTKVKSRKELLDEKRKKALEEREARKKALEDRKKKIAEQRKKAREERLKQLKKNDSIRKAKANEKENN